MVRILSGALFASLLVILIQIGHRKYGRICAYFFSPMPLTRFRSSALRNGRAAMMRAAITCPIPGTVVSSFSVAVLMSIFPSGIFSFACDPFVPTGLLRVIDAAGFAIGKMADESGGVERDRIFSSATKELKADGVCARAFNRPALAPQAPIFSRFASSSNC